MAVAIAASQWYWYDAARGQAERVTYYLFSCAYYCGVLMPAVLWAGRRWRIDARNWRRTVPLHLAVSLFLTGLGVFVETLFYWLFGTWNWPLSAALRHCFRHHTQISLVIYWGLLGLLQTYQIYDEARKRELRSAQLEAQLREAQLIALRGQLKPHFLFNTLQAATTLIYEDPQGAEEVLLSLGELLRISLRAFDRHEIPLRNEIEFLRYYAAIQQRRFGSRLRIDFAIEDQAENCAIPGLLLQPLLENAVRHGVEVHKESDVVTVRARQADGRVRVEIENHVGCFGDSLEKAARRGVGLANVMSRLEVFYGVGQTFEMNNLEPEGVLVSLSFPMRFLAPQAQPVAVELFQ